MSGVKELLETLEITLPLIFFFVVLIKFGYKSQIPAVCVLFIFSRLHFIVIYILAWIKAFIP